MRELRLVRLQKHRGLRALATCGVGWNHVICVSLSASKQKKEGRRKSATGGRKQRRWAPKAGAMAGQNRRGLQGRLAMHARDAYTKR